MVQRKAEVARPPTELADYRPLSDYWNGQDAPSEQSVRWDIRRLRQQLIDASALAYRRGRLLVHPERFRSVIERDALEQARRRAAQNSSVG